MHSQARRDGLAYDASTVYAHLMVAINAASAVSYARDGSDPVSWRKWVMSFNREHKVKLDAGSVAAVYSVQEVTLLRGGLRRFC